MTAPTPLTAEEYLDHLIAISCLPGAVTANNLELLRRLLAEGKTGMYVA